MTIEERKEKYYNYRYIDITEYLNKNDIILIRKMGITVDKKLMTLYEFEVLSCAIRLFYEAYENEDSEIAKGMQSVEEKGISKEDYKNLLQKFESINIEYVA